MRLTIVGGGGFRTPQVFEALARSITGLHVDEVVLYDVENGRLNTMHTICKELAEHLQTRTAVRATTNLRAAVTGSDFIFNAMRVGGTRGRTIDERVALDLGLLGQETVGAGGLAYALRSIPEATRVAEAVADRVPYAWVINFTNPAGIVTETMCQVLGHRVVGICDTPIGLVRRVGRALDLAHFDFDYIGVNHLGWLRSVTANGVERLPELLADDRLLDQIEEARLVGHDWVRATGVLPNEYLYYYLFTAAAIARINSSQQTRGEFLLAQQADFYQEATCCASPLTTWRSALHHREATYMAESRDEPRRTEDVAGGGYQEVALRFMTAVASGSPERMILNVANRHADGTRVLDALPGDMVIEVPCTVDDHGVRPHHVAEPTLAQLGLMARVRASERAIAEAALTGNRDKAWEGFALHPLVDSPALGAELVAGYIAGHPAIRALLRR